MEKLKEKLLKIANKKLAKQIIKSVENNKRYLPQCEIHVFTLESEKVARVLISYENIYSFEDIFEEDVLFSAWEDVGELEEKLILMQKKGFKWLTC